MLSSFDFDNHVTTTMRDCCAANQFDGACEDGICKSVPIPERTINAKRRSFRWFEAVIVVFYVGVAITSAITLDNHFKREALVNQENIYAKR
jgi:hypothetical protein